MRTFWIFSFPFFWESVLHVRGHQKTSTENMKHKAFSQKICPFVWTILSIYPFISSVVLMSMHWAHISKHHLKIIVRCWKNILLSSTSLSFAFISKQQFHMHHEVSKARQKSPSISLLDVISVFTKYIKNETDILIFHTIHSVAILSSRWKPPPHQL